MNEIEVPPEKQRCHFLTIDCVQRCSAPPKSLGKRGCGRCYCQQLSFLLLVFSTSLVKPGSLHPLSCNHCCSWLGWTMLSFCGSCFVLKMLGLRVEPKEWTTNRSAWSCPLSLNSPSFSPASPGLSHEEDTNRPVCKGWLLHGLQMCLGTPLARNDLEKFRLARFGTLSAGLFNESDRIPSLAAVTKGYCINCYLFTL